MSDQDTENTTQQAEIEDDGRSILKPRPIREDVEMDITPMIDITFLLLIFFIVNSAQSATTGVELPQARFGQGVSAKQSIIIKARPQGGNKDCLVILPGGETVTDPELQVTRIADFVEQEKLNGRSQVMLLGSKDIKGKDLQRISSAVGKVEGMSFFLGVEDMGKK